MLNNYSFIQACCMLIKKFYIRLMMYQTMPLYGVGSMACSNIIGHVMFVAEIYHNICKQTNLMAVVFFCCKKEVSIHDGSFFSGSKLNIWQIVIIVEADLAELEIDKENVHYRKKWRRNVMKRKSNPIRKRTINR